MAGKKINTDEIIDMANQLRWSVGDDYHDKLTEGIYTDAASIAKKTVITKGANGAFNPDATIDRVLTSRTWGFPIMLLMLAVVLWLTIEGANVPSAMLFDLLLGEVYPLLKGLASNIGLA